MRFLEVGSGTNDDDDEDEDEDEEIVNGVDAAAAARAERKSAKTGIVLTQVSVHDDHLGEDGGDVDVDDELDEE